MSMRSQKGTVWLQIVLRWSLSQKEKCLGSRWRRASLSWGSKYAWMLFWVSFSIFDKDLLVNKMLNLPFWQYSFTRQMLDTLGSCLLSLSHSKPILKTLDILLLYCNWKNVLGHLRMRTCFLIPTPDYSLSPSSDLSLCQCCHLT